ncbi:CDP-alcohol phosphatidyltransferase family protein [Rhodoblastus acidophilus]|nr:CDP-alcohol phosphatidyltransferase family protein [Rhodoblastus acidophilus]
MTLSNMDFFPTAIEASPSAKQQPHSFAPPIRIQENILALHERATLDRLCDALPSWVKPDHLTALGLFGAGLSGAGYVVSNWSAVGLFIASLGLVLNWFGDSLDGSLARHRGVERPRYGYFLDHTVDAFGNFLLVAGLGASPYVDMNVALITLIGYLLLSIYAFLSHHVSGRLQLSFLQCGPSEIRLALIALNALIYFEGPLHLHFAQSSISVYSLLVGFFGVSFFALFLSNAVAMARDLRRENKATRR